MFDVSVWLTGLAVLVGVTTATWVVSLPLRNASIIDPVWPLLFVISAWTYASATDAPWGDRRGLVLALVTIWGLRLFLHLAVRAWGAPEDRRYQSMRRRGGPSWPVLSLVKVFWLQAGIAWVVSLPLVVAVDGSGNLGPLAALGAVVWLVGFVFEAGGDWQLTRFKADPANAGQVMDRGLWRYSRHPNYFGDATQWFGFWLVSVDAGPSTAWTVVGPIVMTVFLLKVSGVVMLERGMARSRPGYDEYKARTPAFIPGPPRTL